jgi:beta-N-acetylhexosaminidase
MSVLSIGLSGLALTEVEKHWLNHPWVGGVTLFKRNIVSATQCAELIHEIRASAAQPLILSVDQEGGRVQRVIEGATRLPPLGAIGAAHALDREHGLAFATAHATVMASEMLALGFDLSFAPVIDLDRGSRVIGDRAFSSNPHAVVELGRAYISALRECGMAACLKHFPGHGSVLEDTHHERAVDPRLLEALEAHDLSAFRPLLNAAGAVMLAHVEYPAVDALPAGYSSVWIQQLLRTRYGFSGVVISDDIGMLGAGNALRAVDRIHAHLRAGCDHVLVCDPALSAPVLRELSSAPPAVTAPISQLRAQPVPLSSLTAARALLHTAVNVPLLS